MFFLLKATLQMDGHTKQVESDQRKQIQSSHQMRPCVPLNKFETQCYISASHPYHKGVN